MSPEIQASFFDARHTFNVSFTKEFDSDSETIRIRSFVVWLKTDTNFNELPAECWIQFSSELHEKEAVNKFKFSLRLGKKVYLNHDIDSKLEVMF